METSHPCIATTLKKTGLFQKMVQVRVTAVMNPVYGVVQGHEHQEVHRSEVNQQEATQTT